VKRREVTVIGNTGLTNFAVGIAGSRRDETIALRNAIAGARGVVPGTALLRLARTDVAS
jgi:hypothetical protein